MNTEKGQNRKESTNGIDKFDEKKGKHEFRLELSSTQGEKCPNERIFLQDKVLSIQETFFVPPKTIEIETHTKKLSIFSGSK